MSHSVISRLSLISSITILLCLSPVNAGEPEFEPGRAIIVWDSTCSRVTLDSLVTNVNGTLSDSIIDWQSYLLEFPESLDVEDVVDFLKQSACIAWAEPNYYLMWGTNDSLFSEQWYLENHDFPYASIHAPEAWTIENGGDSTVRIAVLDEGFPVDLSGTFLHPDMQNSSTDYPYKLCPMSETEDMRDQSVTRHGTSVASIIAANTNNETGVAGIASRCQILIYKATTNWLSFHHWRHAVNPDSGNADIINFSAGWPSDSTNPNMLLAVNEAEDYGVLVCACAGNRDRTVWYPACFSLEYSNILAVSGTKRNDEWWGSSCLGPAVNISAPADSIWTCYHNDNFPGRLYHLFFATSAATPMVAATAGLVLSYARSMNIELRATELRDIITASADDCNAAIGYPGRDDSLGYGRVNAFKALLLAPGIKTLQSDLTIRKHLYSDVSPYRIRDGLLVPENVTLTLEPGVLLTFDPGAMLIVDGTLIAQGTDQDSIYFAAYDSESWGGIVIGEGTLDPAMSV